MFHLDPLRSPLRIQIRIHSDFDVDPDPRQNEMDPLLWFQSLFSVHAYFYAELFIGSLIAWVICNDNGPTFIHGTEYLENTLVKKASCIVY